MNDRALYLWVGAALLAGSWLLGLGYFYPASSWAWLVVVSAAVAVLGFGEHEEGNHDTVAAPKCPCGGWKSLGLPTSLAILFLLPVVFQAPWPYKAAPLLIVMGLAVDRLPIKTRGTEWFTRGTIAAGVVFFVQALALEVYVNQTARSHELPWPLPEMLAGVATLLGINATANGSSVVLHTLRDVHRLGATWELLFDPATFLFYVAAVTLLGMRLGKVAQGADGVRRSWSTWISGLRALTFILLAWLPFRAGLMMAVYVQRVLRSDPDRPLHAMNHFFSPWMLLLLLVPPVLLAWRFVRSAPATDGPDEPSSVGSLTDAGPLTDEQAITGLSADKNLILSDREVFQDDRNLLAPDQGIFQSELAPASVPCVPSFAYCFPTAAGLIALGAALLTAAIYWAPVGVRRDGRVRVVERHSEWEPTTKPYDTTWFAEPPLFGEASGYNYAAIYDYLGQYYTMSRLLEKDKIDDETLSGCDVLIIKTPTARYDKDEIAAVTRFVEEGGGLLLIGDHTNYERSSTVMNDLTRPMGFIFRDDLLFRFGPSPDEQAYAPALVAHPIVQSIPELDFAVSCSIDPGFSNGRAAMSAVGLWNMGPEYHHENFMPFAQHCAEMRYGAFVQTWAARHGQGRAVAFTDSTIFSNFCVFQPGKAELMLGMVEWLNHGNPFLNPRPWLTLLGLASLAAGLWMARGRREMRLLLLAVGACGWMASAAIVAVANRWDMPLPEPQHPLTSVVIDRTLSTVPLAKGLYPQGNEQGYGMLEAWIPRLGCFTTRKEGSETFSGDALVVLCPTRSVTAEFREQLVRYVADGGRLLVIDSAENSASTANSLLWPFGLSIHHDHAWKGKLILGNAPATIDIETANEVTGGKPLAKLDKLVVAATAKHEKGVVMAIGFGSLWNDKRMGEHWMMEPDITVRARYEALFALLRLFLDETPLPAGKPQTAEPPTSKLPSQATSPIESTKKPPVDLPMQESGPAEM
jgi:hypothetical protein